MAESGQLERYMSKLPTKVSESVRKLNPHLYAKSTDPLAGLFATKRQHHDERQPQRSDADEKAGSCRMVISIVQFRHRLLDSDNLEFGAKWLRDSIARSICVDDGDERITWQVRQIKTEGQQGCIVRIEQL